jgi:hypothetical protein
MTNARGEKIPMEFDPTGKYLEPPVAKSKKRRQRRKKKNSVDSADPTFLKHKVT